MSLLRFLLVGIANTLIGLGAIYGAMYFLRLDIVHANAIGYTIGIIHSYVANKRWTFKSRDHVVASFIRFLLVLAVAYTTNLATVVVLHSRFALDPYLAQAIGIVPYTAIGYLGSRFFAFRTGEAKKQRIEMTNK